MSYRKLIKTAKNGRKLLESAIKTCRERPDIVKLAGRDAEKDLKALNAALALIDSVLTDEDILDCVAREKQSGAQ